MSVLQGVGAVSRGSRRPSQPSAAPGGSQRRHEGAAEPRRSRPALPGGIGEQAGKKVG